jgi:diamine N-acetyltransferase
VADLCSKQFRKEYMHQPKFTFRKAAPDDALCISVLGTQVFLDTYAPDGIRLSLAQEVLHHFSPPIIAAAIAKPDTAFIVAESNHHMVGFAQISAHAKHELVRFPNATELNRLYIQEKFTRRGLGRQLLAEAEKTALASGASALWLTAWIGNARALAFYSSQGYEEVGATLYTFQGEDYENRLFVKRCGLRAG